MPKRWERSLRVGSLGLVAGALATAAPVWAQEGPFKDPRDAFMLLLWLPVVVACFTALELTLWVLAPAPLSAISRVIARARGRCLVTGALTAAVGVFLISQLGDEGGPAGVLAALVLGLLALGTLTGATAVTALLGQGIVDLAGWSSSRALTVVLGAVVLFLAVLVPVVGWALGAYFLLVGLGGALHALAGAGRA